MDFYKTTAAFGATACLLMASSAFGTTIESETFEDTLPANTGWLATGNDAEQVTLASAVAAPTPEGFPTAAASSTKALAIAGSATRTYDAAAGDAFVDMMVKVALPDEALSALNTASGGNAEGAKFAVAIDKVANDTTGQFKYWDKTASAWAELSTETFAADSWVRVTMKFDYTNKKCIVALNGNTCSGGPFDLLDQNATSLASVEVKGSTAIDEVVVAQGTLPAFADDTAKVAGASYATKKWLTANDVTWPADSSAATTLDAQYKFGLDPKGTDTTLPLSFAQDGNNDKATLSFPGFGAFGGTGAYFLDTSSDNSTWTPGATALTVSGTGVNTATVNLPTTPGQAVYYRVRAAAASN